MISLIIAGGVYVAANSQTTTWTDIDNHTLRGEKIPSSEVVCRSMWGTPMLPDGKGGYSLISPINAAWIKESLIIPPGSPDHMVAYRPLPAMVEISNTPSIPAPQAITPQAPAPVAPSAPSTGTAPSDVLPGEAPATTTPAAAAPAPAAPATSAAPAADSSSANTGGADGFAPATGN